MNTRKGFTLVELLVVIAILAILATVSVVGYTAFINGADEQAAISEADQIKTTLNAGLTLKDYVKVDTVYVEKTSTGFAIVDTTTATPADKDVFVASDLAGFGTKLSMKDGVLVYTAENSVVVNVNTLTVVK